MPWKRSSDSYISDGVYVYDTGCGFRGIAYTCKRRNCMCMSEDSGVSNAGRQLSTPWPNPIWKRAFGELGALPPSPRNLPLLGQNGGFGSTTIEALERRIGLRRNATRAPTQAPEWRGRLRPPRISNQTRPIHNLTYRGRELVSTNGGHFGRKAWRPTNCTKNC